MHLDTDCAQSMLRFIPHSWKGAGRRGLCVDAGDGACALHAHLAWDRRSASIWGLALAHQHSIYRRLTEEPEVCWLCRDGACVAAVQWHLHPLFRLLQQLRAGDVASQSAVHKRVTHCQPNMRHRQLCNGDSAHEPFDSRRDSERIRKV